MRKVSFFCLVFSVSLLAATTDFNWTFPVGARVMGMGEAATADAGDPSTAWWNPAGLTEVKGEHIMAMQEKLFSIVPHDTLIFTKSFSSITMGLLFSQSDFSEGLGFSWKEQSVFLSFATSLGGEGQFSVGSNLKYGRLRNAAGSGTLMGLDLGLIYLFNPRFKGGVMFQDIFSRANYSTGTNDTFDPHISFGFSFNTDSATTFNLDFKDFHSGEPDLPLNIKFGVERWLDRVVAVRFGYILSDQDDQSRFTGGVGLVLGPWELDYAFNPNPGPQNRESLRLSVTYRLK